MSKNEQKIHYILYARKSSEDERRQVQSIENQIQIMLDKAKALKLHIVDVLQESKSARKPGRPVFNEMMERIKRGEADGILTWHANRLSRNPLDAGNVQWALQNGTIRSIMTNDREYLPEDNSLMLGMECSMSEQYSKDLSKTVNRGLLRKAKEGWLPNLPPTGYINDKVNKIIINDPERFHLVRKIWDLMLTGNYTPPQILKIANDEWGFRTRKYEKSGGGKLSRSGIYKMLTNGFYLGFFYKKGELFEGSHERMITVDEWDRVQTLLGRKGKPRPKKHSFAFTGAIRCAECQCLITAETKKKIIRKTGEIRSHTYYHCTHKRTDMKCSQRKNTLESGLELMIEQELDKYTILPEFKEWAMEELNKANDNEIETRTKMYEMLHKAYTEAQKQLDTLTKMRYRDLINDEQFLRESRILEAEIAKLKEKLGTTEARAKQWLELTEKTFEFATYARNAFLKGNDTLRKELLLTLGQNQILGNQILTLQAYEWFVPISEDYPKLKAEYVKVRTNKKLSTKAKTDALTSVRAHWSGRRDSNPV
ncbi:MAG: hypothetical protein US63_C0001G0029 [Candidatus Moranbacteria bacterium GW2011_GWC2_37_8]|nr:MAG: hypothetical protein US63_C0001G0029 [Candidatus Moranbacteria bacterium GW2011_GWC2_37_8]KKQ63080.1 MAG: hypothetical protein US82_C0003G0029 [Parcubacteria group bacterium GW2011_GWC1_38_22]